MLRQPILILGFEARRVLTQDVNDAGDGGAKDVNLIIPLNRYSFFEELQDKMLVPMQLQFNLNLQNDNETHQYGSRKQMPAE